ncbi:MAG: glycosyltransferase family 4 protein [Clostridia bacterium]|nr:glycosyltransferase family 4 protein [Clostridia bacterium]
MNKITFVLGSMSRGGAERVVSILSTYYANRNINVEIVTMLNNRVEYELPPSVKLVDVSQYKKGLFSVPGWISKLRRHIKESAPDVVVAFMGPICAITKMACKGLKGRLICSERIDPAMAHRGFAMKTLINRAYAKCDCTVLQTQRAWKYFPKSVQKNSVIIANPISVKCEAADTRKNKIVTAGRLTEQKNHKMLIEAVAEIHKKHPDYTLEIYGEGPLRASLEELARANGLDNAVLLPGNVANLHERMSDAKIFVLSSDYEGLSNALLEAMMMGLPCISTDCAGSDEAITNGENGLLIPVGDKGNLVEALTKLIDDEELRERIGAQAKLSTEEYKVENIIKKWDDVIKGV